MIGRRGRIIGAICDSKCLPKKIQPGCGAGEFPGADGQSRQDLKRGCQAQPFTSKGRESRPKQPKGFASTTFQFCKIWDPKLLPTPLNTVACGASTRIASSSQSRHNAEMRSGNPLEMPPDQSLSLRGLCQVPPSVFPICLLLPFPSCQPCLRRRGRSEGPG